MQEAEDREDEWKETEVDIQGTFTRYQRMRHPMQEDREPIRMEGGASGHKDDTPIRGRSPLLDLPHVGNQDRDRELQEYMKDWTYIPVWPGQGELPSSTPRPGRKDSETQQIISKQRDGKPEEIHDREEHHTSEKQGGRRSERES